MSRDYAAVARIRQKLMERLKAEGEWSRYCAFRELLVKGGEPRKYAWMVAAYMFPPKDGSKQEIDDSDGDTRTVYAQIAANWGNGKYTDANGNPLQIPEFKKRPDGTKDFHDLEPTPPETEKVIKEIRAAPATWDEKWLALAVQVTGKRSDEATDARWVMSTYLRAADPATIDPAEVPSESALTLLYWVRTNTSNLSDFIKGIHVKLMPDKKSIEMGKGFRDDGRTLQLLKDFEDSLEGVELESESEDELEEMEDSTEVDDELDEDELEGEDAA